VAGGCCVVAAVVAAWLPGWLSVVRMLHVVNECWLGGDGGGDGTQGVARVGWPVGWNGYV
jgi:hypothetical protein